MCLAINLIFMLHFSLILCIRKCSAKSSTSVCLFNCPKYALCTHPTLCSFFGRSFIFFYYMTEHWPSPLLPPHTHSFLFAILLLVHDDDQGIKVTILIHFFYCWLLRFFILPSCVQPFHACVAVSMRVCVRFFLICWRIFIFTRKNWVLFSSK